MQPSTLPPRAERVAALYRLAPLVRWEPPQEEMLLAALRAQISSEDVRAELWNTAVDLAWGAAWRRNAGRTPTPAEERAVRIWCLITADRITDEWMEHLDA